MPIYHLGSNPNPQEAWTQLCSNPPQEIAVDTEIASFQNRKLLGIGVATGRSEGFYVTAEDARLSQAIQLLSNPHIRKIYHNAPFDLRVLRQYEVDTVNVDDTAVMARLVPYPSAALEDVSFWVDRQ